MTITLSLPEARRLAVTSQGFGSRPAKPSVGHLRKLAARLHAFQIDSVNVLARAHYVPAFARLGPHDRRRPRTRHSVRLARLGPQTPEAALRDEVHDRDVPAGAQTGLQLL